MGVDESIPSVRLNLILLAAALLAFNLRVPAGFGGEVHPRFSMSFIFFHHFQDISSSFSRCSALSTAYHRGMPLPWSLGTAQDLQVPAVDDLVTFVADRVVEWRWRGDMG